MSSKRYKVSTSLPSASVKVSAWRYELSLLKLEDPSPTLMSPSAFSMKLPTSRPASVLATAVIRSDYDDIPRLTYDSSATSSDDNRGAPRPIARKKAGGKSVLVSNAGDDNEIFANCSRRISRLR